MMKAVSPNFDSSAQKGHSSYRFCLICLVEGASSFAADLGHSISDGHWVVTDGDDWVSLLPRLIMLPSDVNPLLNENNNT